MNKNNIKKYAPLARNEMIAAVTAKAQVLGLSDGKIEPVEVKGDVALIAGRPFPRAVAGQRRNLEAAINREGFGVVMERIAFTWFNRFSALRYMEIHGFLDHGYRVLSHPSGGAIPEILEHATDVDLIGLDKEKVTELRLAGHKDAELYRMLLVAQCNTLHPALPFLFEKTNDETELLLPDNLLHTDSPIRKLVSEIDEADWAEVEIIGWLYQFYISEKKDAVIGKVVKSEDIPAATQLFTPNWIVKYLVQNTLGRQWLATYPQSALRSKMEFYFEPAEQTEEVKAKLREITPTELNPETITFFDPACGSGHILVEAYNLFKEIYLERGYRTRDIPRLILEKNLYGLDIDERAAQLANFALMMKARADERGIFKSEPPIRPNVLAIQESNGLDADEIAFVLTREKIEKLVDTGKPVQENIAGISDGKPVQPVLTVSHKSNVEKAAISSLLALFKGAKTFGSLLRAPGNLVKILPSLEKLVDPSIGRDLAGHTAAEGLRPFVRQARLLSDAYDNVVANPPYMGTKYLNPLLKDYLKKGFKDFEKDLFSAFIIRNLESTKEFGALGFMSPFVWMFISTYEELRAKLIDDATISSLIQLEYSGFDGATVPICTFTLLKKHHPEFTGSYIRLSEFKGAENQAPKTLEAIRNTKCGWHFTARPDDFKKIPGSPIAYWVSDKIREIFIKSTPLERISEIKQGLATCNNNQFLRMWYEVNNSNIGYCMSSPSQAYESEYKWFPYNKGGGYRNWYGNNEFVVNWYKGGRDIHIYSNIPMNFSGAPVRAKPYYFREGVTYGLISSFGFSARRVYDGFIFDVGGSMIFPEVSPDRILGFLCSKLAKYLITILNPTLNYQVGDVQKLPILQEAFKHIDFDWKKVIQAYKADWDSFETSWDFLRIPWLEKTNNDSLEKCFNAWLSRCQQNSIHMRELEVSNNKHFIEGYQLQDEMIPDIPDELITLLTNPIYRYGLGLTKSEYESRFRCDTSKELLSYAVGCMMGRYSLDKLGLVYANAGNEGFDHSQYKTFPADDDGIIPVSDIDWFTDDATLRLVEFIRVVLGQEHLEENLSWIAESFDPKKGEAPVDTIRRYFSTQFFKNHMQMYKKRPIYWLFSSGKQKAFEALVYLHRYNESTLSRMRAQYVTPLQGKINARIEHLRREIDSAGSASIKTKLRKEVETLTKKQTELATFDEELRHYADKRIKLNLDDGVRVNYGKFGNLLAETKAITGGDEE